KVRENLKKSKEPHTQPSQKSSAAAESTRQFPNASRWIVMEDGTPVHAEADLASPRTGIISAGTELHVEFVLRRWLFIRAPYEGYVRSSSAVPTR
ncbi:MAG: hypothetical protein ACO3XO_05035, partial [Bdellovibrionota bacterium]